MADDTIESPDEAQSDFVLAVDGILATIDRGGHDRLDLLMRIEAVLEMPVSGDETDMRAYDRLVRAREALAGRSAPRPLEAGDRLRSRSTTVELEFLARWDGTPVPGHDPEHTGPLLVFMDVGTRKPVAIPEERFRHADYRVSEAVNRDRGKPPRDG